MVRRDTDTDLIRVIACLLVVVIHCCYPATGLTRLYHGLSVVAVPLFAMVSGHYMLQKPRSVSDSLRKAGRLMAVMLCWSALYFVYEITVLHTRSFTGILPLLEYLVTQPNHLWYLYAAAALYLLTPLLSVFSAHADRASYRYALVLTFALGSVIFVLIRSHAFPVLETIVEQMKINYMCGFVFCYLFGGYYRKFGVQKKAPLYVAGVMGLSATLAGVFLLPAQYAGLSVSFFAPGVLLSAAALYVLLRAFWSCHPFQNRLLTGLAGCSMGIYLLHPAAILFLQERMGDTLTTFYMVPLRAALIFALAAVVSYAAKKIPLLKKLF